MDFEVSDEEFPWWLAAKLTLCACVLSKLAVVFVSLFCVSVLSGDVAYTLVALAAPEHQVWSEASHVWWVLAWTVTWLAQVPFWLRVLPAQSALLVHEQVNLALTVYHGALRVFGPNLPLPSMTLVASTESSQQGGMLGLVAVRCSLPLAYAALNGIPEEWWLVLCIMLLDVAPMLIAALAGWLGLREPAPVWRPNWALAYPPLRGPGCGSPAGEDCDVHTCSICLSSLCQQRSGSIADLSRGVHRRMAAGLSVGRLRPQAAASISATRAPASAAGQIARTKCGHEFHTVCLRLAARSLPKCPECRGRLAISDGPEVPDEDQLDAQITSLAFGLLQGVLLLVAHYFLFCDDVVTSAV